MHNYLPESPIGDYLEEGDLNEFGLLLPEYGDLDTEESGGLSEFGAPHGAVGRMIAKLAAKGKINPRKRVALQQRAPRAARLAASAAKARVAAKTNWATFEHLKGARPLNATIGVGARLRHYETIALQVNAAEFPTVQPTVINIPLTAGAGNIEIDNILNSAYGLPVGTNVRYIGAKILFVASTLNRAPGGNITVVRELGVGSALTSTFEIMPSFNENVHVCTFTYLNGAIVSGRARYYAPLVAASTTSTTNFNLAVSGVPTGYTAQVRLLIPGDSEAERLFRII